MFRAVLAGERGPVRDAVLLNAAGALVALDGVGRPGRPRTLHAALAARRVDRARAGRRLGSAGAAADRWVELSVRLRGAAVG